MPSAPEAPGVRVWQIMSRGGARGRGERRRRVLVLPTLKEALLLHAKEGQRLSWKETFKAMTNECEDWSDLDATLNDGLDKETR